MSVIYGWTRNYILWELSLMQLIKYWRYGYRYDMERHGFKFKHDIDEKSREEIRAECFTEEQLKEWEELKKERLKKQYGNDIEGL